MKRLAAALMIAGAALLAGHSIASAYPVGGPTASTSSPTVVSGATFTVAVSPCEVGSVWTFTFQGDTKTDTCTGSNNGAFLLGIIAPTTGTATATFTAPTAPGTYSGTATSGTTTLTFSIVVQQAGPPTDPSGGIPATGTNSITPTITIAVVLLAVGAGMFGVAHLRRRSATV